MFDDDKNDDETLVQPPEIREPAEKLRQIEFYVDLNRFRPELEMLQMIHDHLASKPPLVVMSITFNYQPGNDNQPSLLIANLVHGESLDLG